MLEERIDYLIKSNRCIQIDEPTIKILIDKSKEFIMNKNIPECKNLLPNYIEKVLVYEDKVEIYFKLKLQDETDITTVEIPIVAENNIDSIKNDYKSDYLVSKREAI